MNAVLAAKWPQIVDFQKAFPPFYTFTIEKLLAVRGFVVRAFLFPPRIREQQGLPVWHNLAIYQLGIAFKVKSGDFQLWIRFAGHLEPLLGHHVILKGL